MQDTNTQQNTMTAQDFANKIRAKYPDGVASDGRNYADIPDNELAQKIVDKYPVYKSQVQLQPEAPSLSSKIRDTFTNALGTIPPLQAPVEATKEIGQLPDQISRGTSALTQSASDLGSSFMQRGQDVTQGFEKAGEEYQAAPTTAIDKALAIAHGGGNAVLNTVGQIAGGAGDILGEGIKDLYKTLTPQQVQDTIASGAHKVFDTAVGKAGLQAISKGADNYNQWKQANPEQAQQVESLLNVVSLLGGKEVEEAVTPTIQAAKQTAKESVSSAIKTAREDLANRSTAKNLQSTIDAINPETTGKGTAAAYKEVVTGNRTVTPSGLFTEQTLSPSERAINVGNRLTNPVQLEDGTKVNPVVLGKNHIDNLNNLKTAIDETETHLQDALQKNPGVTADKTGLADKLKEGANSAPEEFRIGDASTAFKSVFNFANKIAQKADDSIGGLRDARNEFDTQAKTQYPNAFKDGAIDTKTPMGAAIKKARDIFNEHLYNTAPNGSDIQKLIGREADILHSAENVAAKAAKGEGKSTLQKIEDAVKSHKLITAAAAYEGIKNTVAPGLPGL